MEIIDLENDYSDKVLKVWDKFKDLDVLNTPECEYRKYPLLPKIIKKNAILFIGINPSFSNKRNEDISNNEIEFYPCISDEEKKIYYFERFKDIASFSNNVEWTHLDLFFLRETNQKVIEQLSYDNIDFLQAQIDISFEIIKRASPRIIVVANSFASEFFGKKKQKHLPCFEKIWMGYDFDFKNDFDNELGTYKIKIEKKDTPIFFSGMLSGQRALDLGSYERLKWHIKRVLDSQQ
jgi:hypothetical protein